MSNKTIRVRRKHRTHLGWFYRRAKVENANPQPAKKDDPEPAVTTETSTSGAVIAKVSSFVERQPMRKELLERI